MTLEEYARLQERVTEQQRILRRTQRKAARCLSDLALVELRKYAWIAKETEKAGVYFYAANPVTGRAVALNAEPGIFALDLSDSPHGRLNLVWPEAAFSDEPAGDDGESTGDKDERGDEDDDEGRTPVACLAWRDRLWTIEGYGSFWSVADAVAVAKEYGLSVIWADLCRSIELRISSAESQIQRGRDQLQTLRSAESQVATAEREPPTQE